MLLALFYAFASALPKLIAHPSAAEGFDEMGWGSAGMYASVSSNWPARSRC